MEEHMNTVLLKPAPLITTKDRRKRDTFDQIVWMDLPARMEAEGK